MASTTAARPESVGLVERVEALRREDPRGAWELMRRSFGAASRVADPAERGALWRTRGHVLRALQRMREAATCYRRAESWYGRAGEIREQGRCAIGLIDALMYLGRHAEAARAARRGRRRLERAGDRVSLARLLNNEANLFHRLDLPARALLRYRDARRALARSGDAAGAAVVDTNVANCLSQLGRLGEARALYERSRRASEAAGRPYEALAAAYNLAYLDFLEHRYEAALASLATLAATAGPSGSAWLGALARLDRAEILLRIGAHGEALAEARQAIEACAGVELGYERAKAETFAALAEFRLGLATAARARLERTLAAFHREGNDVWSAEALVGLATVAWRDGNAPAAAALLAAARRRFARAGDREREGCCLALLARARLEAGRVGGARAALASLRPGRRESPRLAHLRLAAEAALARVRGDRAAARAILTRAARASERLAARILDEHWRSTFWGEWGWPHLDLASLELEDGRLAEALEALEGGRGRALVGHAVRPRRATGAPLPASVRAWSAGRQARDRERTARSGASVARPAAEETLPAGLRRVLAASAPRSIRARSLRRGLEPGTLLLDYLLHDGTLHALSIARDGLAGRRHLTPEARLARLVHALLFQLRGAAFLPASERRADPALAADLASLAADALWPLLGRTPPEALAVLPVGPLTRVPWPALPLPDGRPLCAATRLAVVPGLRLGLARERARAAAVGPPLVVAADAGELAAVEPETCAVRAAFPEARILAGEEATAERFLALAPEADWIHFAGHGHFRADAPHESGLRLADRWLLAGELADVGVRARWVTLSACQTARALVRPGEEWFGLARAFLLAGARTVVASQWDVEDAAAAALMKDLYARLAAGCSVAAALAGTQAACASAGLHPIEWAGFVLLGGPGAVAAGSPGRRSFPPVAVDLD